MSGPPGNWLCSGIRPRPTTGRLTRRWKWPRSAIRSRAIFGWHYPPTVPAGRRLLAKMSYVPAQIISCSRHSARTCPACAESSASAGYFLAAAFPAVLANFIAAKRIPQRGALRRRAAHAHRAADPRRRTARRYSPYKPHLGLLFPIVLAASRTLARVHRGRHRGNSNGNASWGAFGTETWAAFFANIGHTSQAFLSDGWADLAKMQTAFALVRTLGLSEPLAWSVQAVLALVAIAAVTALWRSRADYESRRRRSAPAPCWRRLISTPTTSWCWRCRSPSCGGAGARADFVA